MQTQSLSVLSVTLAVTGECVGSEVKVSHIVCVRSDTEVMSVIRVSNYCVFQI